MSLIFTLCTYSPLHFFLTLLKGSKLFFFGVMPLSPSPNWLLFHCLLSSIFFVIFVLKYKYRQNLSIMMFYRSNGNSKTISGQTKENWFYAFFWVNRTDWLWLWYIPRIQALKWTHFWCPSINSYNMWLRYILPVLFYEIFNYIEKSGQNHLLDYIVLPILLAKKILRKIYQTKILSWKRLEMKTT